jgi:hypothetical protein
MISGIDPSAAFTDLARTQAKADSVAPAPSGPKFNDASDAPDQVSDIPARGHQPERSIGSNLQNAKTEVDTAEQAVQGAELIRSACVLRVAEWNADARDTAGHRAK